jgi:hypothetical protein
MFDSSKPAFSAISSRKAKMPHFDKPFQYSSLEWRRRALHIMSNRPGVIAALNPSRRRLGFPHRIPRAKNTVRKKKHRTK